MIHVVTTGRPFGTNTYAVPLTGSDVFIVDPACNAFSHDEKSFLSWLDSNGFVPRAVVLTHGHFDHVAGLPVLKKEFPDIKIFIHSSDAPFIGQNSGSVQKLFLEAMNLEGFLPYVSNLPEPDFLMSDGNKLSFYTDIKGFEKWSVIHTPGHTEGSCCLYNETENILISGDTVFYHSWGRTDLYGGSEYEMTKSLNRIYSSLPAETKVYPGHDYYGFFIEENM